MSFQIFNARYQKNVAYVNVNKQNIVLSLKAWEILGKPEKVIILYDKDSNQIKLEPNENGQKIHIYPRQTFICAKLSNVMPMGRYYFSLGVFNLITPQRIE